VSSSPPSSSSVENFDSQAASPVAEEVTPKLLVPAVQLHASI
jgi:hypothetical protein